MAFETKNPGIGKYLITSRRVTAADVSAPVAVAPFATRFLALHRTNSLVNLAVIRGKDWAVDHFINLAGPQIVPAIDNWAAIGAFSSLRPSTMARLLSASLPFELTAWTSGWTPIHFSISNPDYGMFDLAFQRTPKTALHRLDSFGDSLLFPALHKQNYYALEKLLASGVSPNIPNRAGVTPLNCACLRVDAQAVRLLIQYGATARVGSSATEGTSLNAFAEGMWENRDKVTREDAQDIFDALVGAGARGDQVGPDSSVEELIRIRFSMGSLHEDELSRSLAVAYRQGNDDVSLSFLSRVDHFVADSLALIEILSDPASRASLEAERALAEGSYRRSLGPNEADGRERPSVPDTPQPRFLVPAGYRWGQQTQPQPELRWRDGTSSEFPFTTTCLQPHAPGRRPAAATIHEFRGDCAEYGLVVLDISDLDSGVKYGIVAFPVRCMAEVDYYEYDWDPVEDPPPEKEPDVVLVSPRHSSRCRFINGYASISITTT
ncbi:hypothetical protein HFD88_009302 [Aspergillus terreus]|nr:hypothetical protein HFD88_009302 [Aspergillus terreus]